MKHSPPPAAIPSAARFKGERIDLKPKYQRDYAWNSKKGSKLLMTILRNRVVPPIVLHEVAAGKFEVLDGKQRLTTILNFLL
jgi:uncharacterized protein with ParB-like and HNH nuclease domain